MKIFHCRCSRELFFDNTQCTYCRNQVGFDPGRAEMVSLNPSELASDLRADEQGYLYRLCKNYTDYNACNWLIDAGTDDRYCLSCRLNQTIPYLGSEEKKERWVRLEAAKRRLVYGLLYLHLPVQPRREYPITGLAFDFLEDRRSNPNVEDEFVFTGHAQGLITVNLIEADDVSRESQRVFLGELYRTLLGHFRHESGHYYFDQLVANTEFIAGFRKLFGDEQRDYSAALQDYHDKAETLVRDNKYISRYAQSHPLEDWAETWSHYLHMADALETAMAYQLLDESVISRPFRERIQRWIKLSLALNGLNRSMGLKDAYPFVLSDAVLAKMHFIDDVVAASRVAPSSFSA